MFFVLSLRKLVCVLAAVVILALPLMACALPGLAMSDEEQACCREMAGQCGTPDMPDSHSCCKQSAVAQNGLLQIKQGDASAPEMAAQVAGNVFVVPSVSITTMDNNCPAFPESPPGHTSILRI